MLPPGHEAQPQQHAGVHVAQGPAPAIPSPLAWISCRIHSPAPRGASLSPEQCSQHGMSSKIAAGKSGSERGAEPCPWAEDQECLFPIQHAKALNPAKPQCLFLPLASKGWQQKHVQGRRSSVEEGSGFLLGLSDLFWFGKNRRAEMLTMHIKAVSTAPAAEQTLWPPSDTGNWSPEPQLSLWLLGWNQKSSSWECLCLFARKIYVQPRNLAMGALSSSPGSLGYSSCCGTETIFPQLAAAEPSFLGVHGLGIMSAMPLAMRIPLTLTSLLRKAGMEKELLRQGQEKG